MINNKRKSRSAFTLIELMVVLFIIGILSAVAIPYMRARTDAAKWSEGKAVAGSIHTAARAYCAERGESFNYPGTTLRDLGFTLRSGGSAVSDIDGKYLSEECYAIDFTGYDRYTITVDSSQSIRSDAPASPSQMTLDNTGAFVEIP
jgi:prepilin-type N-terminal cleavage/methylation domain-containing protein